MSQRDSRTATPRTKPAPPARFVPHRHERSDDGNAFIPDPEDGPARTRDSLAENLAEEYLQGATGGDAVAEELNDEVVPEELGGPFVETSAREEFAAGTDESNPPDAETEPLPLTGAGMVTSTRESDRDREEDSSY